MTITFDSTNLAGADTSNMFDQPNNFRIDPHHVMQSADLVRGTKPNLHHRGNRQYSLSWDVSRHHSSVAAAEQFLVTHAALFTATGTVTVTPESGTALVLTPAIVTASPGTFKGEVTFHSYSVVGTIA